MTEAQIENEIQKVVKLIDEVYKKFGFTYHVELSTRPDDSMGTEEEWEVATNALENAIKAMNLSLIHISTDVTNTGKGRKNLNTYGRAGICLNIITNFTREKFNSISDEFVNSSDTKTGEYDTSFVTTFFSGKENLCTGSSFRERKNTMFFNDKSLTKWNHETDTKDTTNKCN